MQDHDDLRRFACIYQRLPTQGYPLCYGRQRKCSGILRHYGDHDRLRDGIRFRLRRNHARWLVGGGFAAPFTAWVVRRLPQRGLLLMVGALILATAGTQLVVLLF